MAAYFIPQRIDVLEVLVKAGTPIDIAIDGRTKLPSPCSLLLSHPSISAAEENADRGGLEVTRGDTALHLLAKNKAWASYNQLKALGARDDILNFKKVSAKQLYKPE